MKKIYALALSALLCGFALADNRQPITKNIAKSLSIVETSTMLNTTGGVQRAPQRAASFGSIDDMAGAWEWSGQNLLTSNAPSGELTITITNATTGAATISGFIQNFVLQATIDFAKGTVSIPNNQDLGRDSNGDKNYFYLKDVTADGNTTDGLGSAAASVGKIEGTTIVFPELDVWAFGDYNQENLGWWYLCYANTLTSLEFQGDPNEGWEDFGTADFEDGWIMPGFEEDPSSAPWTVNVQKSTETTDLYRLNKPYLAESCPSYIKEAAKEGYIVFSIADPEFVQVLPKVYSGFDNGSNKLNLFNIEGFYIDMGLTKADIQDGIKDQNVTYSTYADGVVNIPNCRFNMPSALDKAYSWSTSENVSLADKMVAKITIHKLAGVDNVVAGSDAEAPAEYFNLQGVRVANPEAGQLVIKRQGSTVTKMIAR